MMTTTSTTKRYCADSGKWCESANLQGFCTLTACKRVTYAAETIYTDGPMIEYVPVKHGRWKHEHLVSTGGGTYEVVRCSLCDWQYPTFETNYCPNCGARMDGDNNDEQ